MNKRQMLAGATALAAGGLVSAVPVASAITSRSGACESMNKLRNVYSGLSDPWIEVCLREIRYWNNDWNYVNHLSFSVRNPGKTGYGSVRFTPIIRWYHDNTHTTKNLNPTSAAIVPGATMVNYQCNATSFTPMWTNASGTTIASDKKACHYYDRGTTIGFKAERMDSRGSVIDSLIGDEIGVNK